LDLDQRIVLSTVRIDDCRSIFTSKLFHTWAYSLTEQAHKLGIPVFMKEDLVPIMGEENMIQEMPEAYIKVLEEQKKWRR
jgi:hypothetical protein